MWDKNRPSRIIPRTEVYTSGDVTIEELRGEGEEPRLTAEALAERIGQHLPGDDDSSEQPAPLPGVVHFRDAAGRRRRQHADRARPLSRARSWPTTGGSRPSARRRPTSSACSSTGCSTSTGRRDLPRVDGAGARARMGAARGEVGAGAAARRRAGREDRHPDPLRRPARGRPGPDRQRVAAKERYGAPVIVVDFGTSTNFDVVSPAGEYVGGVIAPGIEISMEALFARAARLVRSTTPRRRP